MLSRPPLRPLKGAFRLYSPKKSASLSGHESESSTNASSLAPSRHTHAPDSTRTLQLIAIIISATDSILILVLPLFRSLPKLSSQDDDGADSKKKEVPQFEPIPHDHNFCERVVINVCAIRGFCFRCLPPTEKVHPQCLSLSLTILSSRPSPSSSSSSFDF